MRISIKVTADSDKKLILPIQYNYLLQSLIYNSLEDSFADFLHERGFEGGGRTFKLFTFSRLMSRFKIIDNKIEFHTPTEFVVSSPIEEFCQSFMNGILSKGVVRLGSNNHLRVESVRVKRPKINATSIKMRLLSPVVVYSTLLRPEGSKYTCYFQPGEGEFLRLFNDNLKNKYKALYNECPPKSDVEVKVLNQPRLHVMRYKGIVVKGYTAPLKLKGPEKLLQLALDAGVGSKNSMGFGCGELIN